MKKILLGAAALSVVFATSCKKSDDNNSSPSNSWTVNGTSHSASMVTKTSTTGASTLTAADASGNSFIVVFKTYPTANGTYHVSGDIIPQNNTDVTIGVSGSTGQFFSLGNDNVNATITVNSGKVNVSLPDTWVGSVTGTDSVKVNGNITEN